MARKARSSGFLPWFKSDAGPRPGASSQTCDSGVAPRASQTLTAPSGLAEAIREQWLNSTPQTRLPERIRRRDPPGAFSLMSGGVVSPAIIVGDYPICFPMLIWLSLVSSSRCSTGRLLRAVWPPLRKSSLQYDSTEAMTLSLRSGCPELISEEARGGVGFAVGGEAATFGRGNLGALLGHLGHSLRDHDGPRGCPEKTPVQGIHQCQVGTVPSPGHGARPKTCEQLASPLQSLFGRTQTCRGEGSHP